MSGEVIDDDRDYRDVLRNLAGLVDDPGITIGIHGEDNDPYERGQGEPVTTAQIGSFHEFGTLDRYEDSSPAGGGGQGVPQRSFLRSTMDDNRTKYSGMISKVVGRAIDGSMSIDRGLGLVGAKASADVQRKIQSNIPPPLTQTTIDRKKSSTALIDTGQLVQAISWQVSRD